MGSCRTTPTALVAAAVVSEAIVAPRKTPCCQLKAWKTSGISVARRPPNTSAEIGTPSGLSHSGDIDGHWWAGVVKRELGCAAFVPLAGVQGRPCQSSASGGGPPSMPSQYGVPRGVSATLVKSEFFPIVAIMLGLVFEFVPGATPKTPASGLIARSWPSAGFIHAMSSPTVHTVEPLWRAGARG